MDRKLILGIETSCDETAAAVVADGKKILSNIVSSQVNLHRKFGGVVPEIASRRHLEVINPVVVEALEEAQVGLEGLSAVAVTQGPGLAGALLVGVATAKALCYGTGLDLVGVSHIEGHIYANFLEHPQLVPPLVALVVSGGHTTLIYMKGHGDYEVLGRTLDDAAGEAFDKVAGFLGLGYPGGPPIDRLARQGNPEAIDFPRAMLRTKDFDFSFSGLKTAVLNYVSKAKAEDRKVSTADLCASFQAAAVDVQVHKLMVAAKSKDIHRIVLAGGVAANTALRGKVSQRAKEEGLKVYYPSSALCTDNAAMIACLGYFRWRQGSRFPLSGSADPNLPLV